jgi:hypothetical protein
MLNLLLWKNIYLDNFVTPALYLKKGPEFFISSSHAQQEMLVHRDL